MILCALLLGTLSASAGNAPKKPAAVVRIVGHTVDAGRPKLQLAVRLGSREGASATRLTAGADVVGVVQARFGSSAGHVYDALVLPLGKAMAKRRLKPAATAVVEALAAAEVVRFYAIQPGVILEASSEARVARIAERYFRATGGTLLVTSAKRTAYEQAEAMYTKVRSGGSLGIYRDRSAVKAIRDAAKAARKAKGGRSQIIAAIANVISGQMRRGLYISKHLLSGAVDIRSTGMSSGARRAFRRAALAEPGVTVLYEPRPPHFHLALP